MTDKPKVQLRDKALDREFIKQWNGSASETARRCGIPKAQARQKGYKLKQRNLAKLKLAEAAELKGLVNGREEGAAKVSCQVAITRNDIINGLAGIAKDVKVSASARVGAYGKLSDIFQLTAKAAKDEDPFVGWTDEELEAYRAQGTIPARFGVLPSESVQ